MVRMALYDNDRGIVQNYTASAASNFLTYPDKNQISILGPVWLPRIYGKDLTAFEIASSGIIAVTIQDVHSFDLTREGTTIGFAAQSNDSFLFTTGDSNVKIGMDGAADTLSIFAKTSEELRTSNLTIAASNIYFRDPVDFDVFFGKGDSNISLTSSNWIALTASNGITLDAPALNITGGISLTDLTSATDINIAASNDVSIYGGSNINLTTSNVQIATSNFTVGDGSGYSVFFGEGASNVALASANNAAVTASNGIALSAPLIEVTGQVLLDNVDAFIHVNSNWIDFYAGQTQNHYTSNSEYFWVANAFNVTAGTDLGLYGGSNVAIASAGSNVFALLDAATSSFKVAAAGGQTFTASNDIAFQTKQSFTVEAGKDVDVHAASNFVLAMAASNAVFSFTKDSATLYAQSNFTAQLDGGDWSVYADQGDVLLNAGNQAKLTLDNVTQAADLYAFKDVSLMAETGAFFETAKTSADFWAASSNLHFSLSNDGTAYLTAATGAAKVTAQTDIALSADAGAQKVTLDSATDKTTIENSVGATAVLAKTDLALRAASSNVEVLLTDATKSLFAGAASNVDLWAAASNVHVGLLQDQTLVAAAAKDLSLIAAASNVEVLFKDATKSLFVGAASNVDLWAAASNVHVALKSTGVLSETAAQSIDMTAQAAGISLAAATTLTGVAGTSASFSASNEFSAWGGATAAIAAGSNAGLDFSNSAKSVVSHGDNVYFKASDGVADMMKMVYDAANSTTLMTLYGQLDIVGAINSIAVTQTNLEVEDKTLTLAFGTSNDDGVTNDKSGIVIAGLPDASQASDSNYVAQNEKSLKWYKNADSTTTLGTDAGLDSESYWELRGGQFRLTQFSNATDFLSFAFRIGARNELELVKITSAGGSDSFKVIGRFGRTLI